jgi:hypothetical protein
MKMMMMIIIMMKMMMMIMMFTKINHEKFSDMDYEK